MIEGVVVAGARSVPFLRFGVGRAGWVGGFLGFDGSLRGADRNAPRLKPPGWLLAEVRFWER